MPSLPTEVQPGDIISSELMNIILERLSELSTIVLTGTQTVPDVIGMLLGDAANIIQAPSRQISLGFVLDTTGASLNPNNSSAASLVVINQSPVGGTLIPINAPVNLVVSQLPGDEPSNPVDQPTIASTETLEGDLESDFPVGGTLVLVGTNFSANPAQNIVTFNGVTALVSSDPADPTRRLLVTVPEGIDGAPEAPDDAPLMEVDVVLRHAITNQSASTAINVIAPVPDAPTIISVSHSIRQEGGEIVITGTNFGSEPQVVIRDVQAEVTDVDPDGTEITVVVPDFDDVQQNAVVSATIVVNVPGVGSVPFNGVFNVLGVG